MIRGDAGDRSTDGRPRRGLLLGTPSPQLSPTPTATDSLVSETVPFVLLLVLLWAGAMDVTVTSNATVSPSTATSIVDLRIWSSVEEVGVRSASSALGSPTYGTLVLSRAGSYDQGPIATIRGGPPLSAWRVEASPGHTLAARR
jgi:hypothetical protein